MPAGQFRYLQQLQRAMSEDRLLHLLSRLFAKKRLPVGEPVCHAARLTSRIAMVLGRMVVATRRDNMAVMAVNPDGCYYAYHTVSKKSTVPPPERLLMRSRRAVW